MIKLNKRIGIVRGEPQEKPEAADKLSSAIICQAVVCKELSGLLTLAPYSSPHLHSQVGLNRFNRTNNHHSTISFFNHYSIKSRDFY